MRRYTHCSARSLLPKKNCDDGQVRTTLEQQILFSKDKELVPEVKVKRVSQIKAEVYDRYEKRYSKPSREWIKKNRLLYKGNFTGRFIDQKLITKAHKDLFNTKLHDPKTNKFYINPDRLYSKLSLGDLCLLDQLPDQLVMCVEMPSDEMDGRFAFAKQDGTLVYSVANRVMLRLPRFNSASITDICAREADHGFKPVGLVKNDISVTYLIPNSARQLFTSYVPSKITELAKSLMPETCAKLELIHRRLQSHESPWQISIFKLVEIVSVLELPTEGGTAHKLLEAALQKVGVLPEELSDLPSSMALKLTPPKQLDAAVFVATYWALLQQQGLQMWGEIVTHRALFSPISVTVLPFENQVLFYQDVIKMLEDSNYSQLDNFAYLVNKGDYLSASAQNWQLIDLLSDYCAGNFQNNDSVTYLIARLFRKLKEYQDLDVSRDKCFELLKKLRPTTSPNPLHWSHLLQLPESSKRSKLDQKLFDVSVPRSSEYDIKRPIFYKEVCYCIDSEDALEIDDGVAVRHIRDQRYKVFVHVADPASLFKTSRLVKAKYDPVLAVAMNRAFTTYLPDKSFRMMPKSYSDEAGLGKWLEAKNTVTFSVDVDLATHALICEDTFKIELGRVTKSKSITYNFVDSVLNNEKSETQEELDLKVLYKIASKLKNIRVKKNGALTFDHVRQGILKLQPNERGELINVTFYNEEQTKSKLLVSELMIMANMLSGKYFSDNGIPGIYRSCQELDLKNEAATSYLKIRKSLRNGSSVPETELMKISPFFSSSSYSAFPRPHTMVGASKYLTVTSPLRRFPDLLNHLQIHRHLRSLPFVFSQEDTEGINWHILSRDMALKTHSRRCNKYWTLKYIKDLIESAPSKNRWTVSISSLPNNGFAQCRIQNLFSATGMIKLDMSDERSALVAGDSVTSCYVSRLDCLEGLLELSLTKESTVIKEGEQKV
ncbi:HDL449Cp [Eremothecium sinecaudum]|uniref:HDL449Cp n=1 Tax=Eremothecium sinecaudum TaxID=45286 RepID=A0A120K236_9SACH|nr:HDL449Cp [Eremothecium sinecaudum]AMD20295.1 HDL449Cp [Eremothecium sinecaudum]